jgi:ATP/ADP translocase
MLLHRLLRILDIQSGEAYRVGVMASLLFFLIAANNLIKILRDSIFLGHHSVSELPYLYILVAVHSLLRLSLRTQNITQIFLSSGEF